MCSIRRKARSRSRSSSTRRRARTAGRRRAAVVSSCSPAAGRRRRESRFVSPGTCERRLRQASQILDQRSPLRQSRGVPQVLEHDLSALAIELDVTPGGQKREPLLDLLVERTATAIDERDEPPVEAELAVLLPDQVDHRQVRLAVGAAKAATDLLRKDGGAVRRTEQQHRVDAGTSTPSPRTSTLKTHRARRPRVAQALSRASASSSARRARPREARAVKRARHVLARGQPRRRSRARASRPARAMTRRIASSSLATRASSPVKTRSRSSARSRRAATAGRRGRCRRRRRSTGTVRGSPRRSPPIAAARRRFGRRRTR